MRSLETRASGKVNLCLFVGVPRADGYHPLVSVFQAVALADDVRLDPAPRSRADEVVCAGVDGPNLAEAALGAYRAASGWDGPPVRVTIVKRIPVAAGMGGGSADAAAALRLVAHAAGRPGDPILARIAPGLGADVPSQLVPGRALVTGVGEHVEDLADAGAPAALLVVPSAASLSTAAVYREADRLGSARPLGTLAAAEREVRATLAAGAPLPVVNDLQAAARSLRPSIDDALEAVRAAGARSALVTGSGPTVFGVFDDVERAQAAAVRLGDRHPGAIAIQAATAADAAVREL